MGLLGDRKPNIESLTRAGDVDGLARAAGFREEQRAEDGRMRDLGAGVRAEAILALGAAGPDAAPEAVMAALADPADRVRCAAVHVLHGRGQSAALVGALGSLPRGGKSFELARRAVPGLEHAVEPRLVAEALIRRADEAALSEDDAALILALSRPKPDSGLIQGLITALADERPAVAQRAVRLLVQLTPHSNEALSAELRDGSAPAAAAGALAAIADPATSGALIAGLSHPQAGVRAECAAALAELRDPLAAGPLLTATRDHDYEVRTQAAVALDQLGTVGVIAGLAELLQDGPRNGHRHAMGAVAETLRRR